MCLFVVYYVKTIGSVSSRDKCQSNFERCFVFFDPESFMNPLPTSGRYAVVVGDVVMKENQENDTVMYQLTCSIVRDKKWDGYTFVVPMMVKHPNPKAMAIGLTRMKELCRVTTGRETAATKDELCNRVVAMNLLINPDAAFKVTVTSIESV